VLELDYLLVDVFTDQPFGGSRLHVFPHGDGLSETLMQKLAQELGAGETAFMVSARSPGPDRRGLRVFTPAVEIPFGGHSVLGATFALDHLGLRTESRKPEDFSWELDAGLYQVNTVEEGGARIYSLTQDTPAFLGQYFHRSKVARTLSISEEDIAITGLPCEIISTGLPTHIVPVGSLETMGKILLRHGEADSIARDLGFGDLFVFTCETESPEVTVHCRMFAPHFGIPEDAASGAATGALIAYMVKHRLIKSGKKVRLISEQGMEMGRPSRLIGMAEISNGQATSIQVGGQCVLMGSGCIQISQ
jgi:trans-2,3-dihydro-3-hydroxyanthranilate isomerase